MADILEVEVLEDGTLKVTSGKVSMPNHAGAEAFLRDLARGCGGKTERHHKAGVVGAVLHAAKHIVGGVGHSHG